MTSQTLPPGTAALGTAALGTAAPVTAPLGVAKTPTGIAGLDEITFGGFPAGRPTLVCGQAGCGKTLLAMTFLLHGALRFDEPGVFMSFEESGEDLAQNIASLGYDLPGLVAGGRIAIDYVRVERSEIEETGDYDLEGLFIRLDYAIKSVGGAKRVVLDTLETLFSGLQNVAILRSELRRLFGWLKRQGVTAVITAERGDGGLTRHGLEEYVSDCVLLLDNRAENGVATRRLRVVKYRGSAHGSNEYPFLIDERGISVLPVTSAGLNYDAGDERVSTGVAGLDEMLGAGGFFRGSSILLSGGAGTGKTSLASHFVEAACRRGERCIYFAYEESPRQIERNMRSIGVHLAAWTAAGLLRVEAARPSLYGLETHLAHLGRDIDEFAPAAVVIDPISSLRGDIADVHATLLRMIDLLKGRGITAILVNLVSAGHQVDATEQGMSSLMDTWISLVNLESNGERNRGLYVLKSRGMRHSNQVREFQITADGVKLVPAYLGPAGVLAGSARLVQEAQDLRQQQVLAQEIERRRRDLVRRGHATERQIAELRLALEAEEQEVRRLAEHEEQRASSRAAERAALAAQRGVAP